MVVGIFFSLYIPFLGGGANAVSAPPPLNTRLYVCDVSRFAQDAWLCKMRNSPSAWLEKSLVCQYLRGHGIIEI